MAKCLGLLSMLVLAALRGSGADDQAIRKGLIYRPASGQFWDPSVIYFGGKYYMYSMYGGDSVWLATSKDGVHWKDYGVVLKSGRFKNQRPVKQYVATVSDRYIMNDGAFTDQGSNIILLRFYEQTDLIHWNFLYDLPV